MLLSGLNLSTLRSLVITIPRSYRVSTENGSKSVLLGNLNRFNRKWLQLKRLIPIEHDLSKMNVLNLLSSSFMVQGFQQHPVAACLASKQALVVEFMVRAQLPSTIANYLWKKIYQNPCVLPQISFSRSGII